MGDILKNIVAPLQQIKYSSYVYVFMIKNEFYKFIGYNILYFRFFQETKETVMVMAIWQIFNHFRILDLHNKWGNKGLSRILVSSFRIKCFFRYLKNALHIFYTFLLQ